MLTFFKSEKLTPHVTRIFGITGEIMYLVEGENDSALIDTGLGVGDLKAFVESKTKKPVTVIITHGHVDHAMGAPAFEEVYMNVLDDDIFAQHSDVKIRKDYIKMMIGESQFDQIKDNDYIYPGEELFSPLEYGDVFDLGGITLEIFKANGHTPGSVAILIKEEHMLLLGDSCNSRTFMFDSSAPSIEEYKESLVGLKSETDGLYDRVLLSHGSGDAGTDMIDSVIAVCDDIMNGSRDDIPFEFMGSHALVAKATDENYSRLDGGSGNIVFRKDNIFKSQK